MTLLKTFAFLSVALLLASCGDEHFEMGPMRSETRDVSGFNAIDLDGDGRLEVVIGGPASFSIEGRERAVERATTEVRDGTLYIKNQRRDWLMAGGGPRLVMRITVPRLDSLKLDGGNDVRLSGFDGGDFDIKVQGATHLKGNGTLEALNVAVSGAGHADFSKLVANEAKVTVNGVGSVYVNAKESLDATMNGVGAIIYHGNPHAVNTSMNGLGTIAQYSERHAKRLEKRERRKERERRQEIDPDSLQPEYEEDKDPEHPVKMPDGGVTEVI